MVRMLQRWLRHGCCSEFGHRYHGCFWPFHQLRRRSEAICRSSSSSILEILAASWSEIAQGYENLLVPCFAPWTQTVLHELSKYAEKLPDGPVVVPCCGTGQELVSIGHLIGGRPLIGIDLAPGMVERSLECIALHGAQATLQCGDASVINECHCAAIVSIFGLQQLPSPCNALVNWCEALAPGGVLIVCFWPPGQDCEALPGPWAVYSEVIAKALHKDRSGIEPSWPSQLVPQAVAAGMTVLADCSVQHEISWDTPETCWEVMTRAGPWHASRLLRGDDFVNGLKESFLEKFDTNRPLVHAPSARLLVLERS